MAPFYYDNPSNASISVYQTSTIYYNYLVIVSLQTSIDYSIIKPETNCAGTFLNKPIFTVFIPLFKNLILLI